ncbi:MAG TPA: pilin [Candidatus Nanoarchaeia archaeon]|nr:pilin [Candidatus Nanoarchaeia archaeon]
MHKKFGFVFLGMILTSILFTAFIPFAANAQLQYQPLSPLPETTQQGTGDYAGKQVAKNLPNYLVGIFRLLIGLASVMAVIQITIGGIQYMSTDAIGGKSEGKERIEQAILGLLLAIGAYLILYTVNPKTLEFKFNPNAVPVQQTSGNTGTTGTNPGTPTPTNTTNGYYQKYKICYSYDPARSALPLKTAIGGTYPFTSQDAKTNAQRSCAFDQPRIQSIPNPSNGECPAGFTDRYVIRCEPTYTTPTTP